MNFMRQVCIKIRTKPSKSVTRPSQTPLADLYNKASNIVEQTPMGKINKKPSRVVMETPFQMQRVDSQPTTQDDLSFKAESPGLPYSVNDNAEMGVKKLSSQRSLRNLFNSLDTAE